jgi:hypothetical protein
MLAIGVSMHKVKEILRLYFDAKLSQHQIAASLNLSSGVVNKYLALAKAAQLIWPLPQEMDEVALRRLWRPYVAKGSHYNEPDYASVHQELKQKGVTLLLLWQEYESTHGKRTYRYAQYCAKYREWLNRQNPACVKPIMLVKNYLLITADPQLIWSIQLQEKYAQLQFLLLF